MNPIYILSNTNIEGKVVIDTVPNATGTVLTYNPTTKEVSTRTNTELISDLNLVTSNQLVNYVTVATPQDINARKSIGGGTSNTYDGAAIEIRGNGSTIYPSLSFHQPGAFAGVMSYRGDDYGYYFMDGTATVFRWLNALGYRKSGSDDNYVLTGAGGHKPISDFATTSQLSNYLTNGSAIQIDGGGGIANGSDSRVNKAWFEYNWANTGLAGSGINFSGLNGNYSTEIFASYGNGNEIGFRTRNGDIHTWNLHHWIWHTGNFNPANYTTTSQLANYWSKAELPDYRNYGLGTTLPNAGNINDQRETGIYYVGTGSGGNKPWDLASVFHTKYTANEYAQLAIRHGQDGLAFRTDNYDWKTVYHSGNLDVSDVVTKSTQQDVTGLKVIDRVQSVGAYYGNTTDMNLYSMIYKIGIGPNTTDNRGASIGFYDSTSGGVMAGIYVKNNNQNGTSMAFATTHSFVMGPQIGLTMNNYGKVNFERVIPSFQGLDLATQNYVQNVIGSKVIAENGVVALGFVGGAPDIPYVKHSNGTEVTVATETWCSNNFLTIHSNQNVTGIKRFLVSPIIPNASLPVHPVNLGQLSGILSSGYAKLASNQTFAGTNIFTLSPKVPFASQPDDAVPFGQTEEIAQTRVNDTFVEVIYKNSSTDLTFNFDDYQNVRLATITCKGNNFQNIRVENMPRRVTLKIMNSSTSLSPTVYFDGGSNITTVGKSTWVEFYRDQDSDLFRNSVTGTTII